MRQLTILVLALVLAACGGNSAVVPTQAPPVNGGDAGNEATGGGLDLDPFGVESEDENIDPVQAAAEAEATVQALGIPVQPTLPPGTVVPLGGLTVQQTLLPPGQVAEATEDPNIDLVFQSITYIRTGGPAGADDQLEIQLFQDGTLIRNGVQTQLGPQVASEIDTLLDQNDILGLYGTFTSVSPDFSNYFYTLAIEREDASVTLRAEAALTPPELAEVIVRLEQLGS